MIAIMNTGQMPREGGAEREAVCSRKRGASLGSTPLTWVLKGCLGLNKVRGEGCPRQETGVCEKELWVPGPGESQGVAGHTQQEQSGIEAGEAGWGEAGYFSGAMRSQPIQIRFQA